ncbi:MAG: hypothetical protein QNJ19_03495 [Woeseiaceae bacterium]|nr:hypothetical protein [Woeseiaceae bacterium]
MDESVILRGVLLFVVLLPAGCELRVHENLFIIPNGYTGPVELILIDGADAAYSVIDNRNVYVIPASGVLCVASFKNFTSGWGITHARYEDSSEIPLAPDDQFDDVRFGPLLQRWSATLSHAGRRTEVLSDPELLFYIGNSIEMSEARESWSKLEPVFRREFCAEAP